MLLMIFAFIAQIYCAEPNPFLVGVKSEPLTEEQQRDLLAYAKTTQEKLGEQLKECANISADVCVSRLNKVMIRLVLDSAKNDSRRKLLSRMLINQGLDLVYGVPDGDGKSVSSPATLQGISIEFMKVVLVDSANLALKYSPQESSAIAANEITNIPFSEAALDRLSYVRKWSKLTLNTKKQSLLIQKGLEHFLVMEKSPNKLSLAASASRITQVEEGLAELNSLQSANAKVRVGLSLLSSLNFKEVPDPILLQSQKDLLENVLISKSLDYISRNYEQKSFYRSKSPGILKSICLNSKVTYRERYYYTKIPFYTLTLDEEEKKPNLFFKSGERFEILSDIIWTNRQKESNKEFFAVLVSHLNLDDQKNILSRDIGLIFLDNIYVSSGDSWVLCLEK